MTFDVFDGNISVELLAYLQSAVLDIKKLHFTAL